MHAEEIGMRHDEKGIKQGQDDEGVKVSSLGFSQCAIDRDWRI